MTVNVQYKFCRWLDSNHSPLESEATVLPTVPQPLPIQITVWYSSVSYNLHLRVFSLSGLEGCSEAAAAISIKIWGPLFPTFSDFFRQRLFWRNKKFCAKSRVWRWHFREKAVATFDLGYIVLINKTLISSFTNWLYCHENRYQLLQKRFTAKSFDLCVNLQRFRSEKVFLVYKRYILTYLLNAYLIVRPMKICNFKLNNN